MKNNMGSADRILRILAAIVIAVLYFTGQIEGVVGIILGLLAIILVLTSLVGFCPLYLPFKLSTKKAEKAA